MLLLAPLLLLTVQGAPEPPAWPPRSRTAPETRAEEPGSDPAAADQDYRIGPSDVLRVVVYGVDDLTQTVIVQADGTFNYPLIGRVKALDATPRELERRIALQLSQGFVRDPQVSVVVHEYRSKNVFVVGEVTRPGTYPLSGRTTLIEILSRAGQAGAGTEVAIIRPSSEVSGPVLPEDVAAPGGETSASKQQAEVIRLSVHDIQSGQLDQNVVLRPNDTIFVSSSPRFYVSGEVRNPGAFFFSPRITVRQAISMAGGLTPDGSSGRLRIVREVKGRSKELKVKLDDPVQPGDTIMVRAKLF